MNLILEAITNDDCWLYRWYTGERKEVSRVTKTAIARTDSGYTIVGEERKVDRLTYYSPREFYPATKVNRVQKREYKEAGE